MYTAPREMNGDKAPGPDGLSIVFWQSSWDFVKTHLMNFLETSMRGEDSFGVSLHFSCSDLEM